MMRAVADARQGMLSEPPAKAVAESLLPHAGCTQRHFRFGDNCAAGKTKGRCEPRRASALIHVGEEGLKDSCVNERQVRRKAGVLQNNLLRACEDRFEVLVQRIQIARQSPRRLQDLAVDECRYQVLHPLMASNVDRAKDVPWCVLTQHHRRAVRKEVTGCVEVHC